MWHLKASQNQGMFLIGIDLGAFPPFMNKPAKRSQKVVLSGGMFTKLLSWFAPQKMGKMSMRCMDGSGSKKGDRFESVGVWYLYQTGASLGFIGFPIVQQKTKCPWPIENSVWHWFLAFVDVHVDSTFGCNFSNLIMLLKTFHSPNS